MLMAMTIEHVKYQFKFKATVLDTIEFFFLYFQTQFDHIYTIDLSDFKRQ